MIEKILNSYKAFIDEKTNSSATVCLKGPRLSQTCHAAMLGGSTLALLKLGLWPLSEGMECPLSPVDLTKKLFALKSYGMHVNCASKLRVAYAFRKADVLDPSEEDLEHMRIQAGKLKDS